ncbi:TonB-dependent receptor domain-containing protein [Paracoccus aminophilus]|uniref:TonB-dependent heme/hemoglobin receptor family protein n=1 Tax=Paracoccus aminophilus JCM 7686 TaxID=1367847 RepID=S5YYJ6_PARAH|nr:TonB-dependent receptor [Paracoccus aminophilus]AGT10276.1 TonB-dependent heme/hemoglobin receptor family protein [Paracoccus aminophilus JCM 7686]
MNHTTLRAALLASAAALAFAPAHAQDLTAQTVTAQESEKTRTSYTLDPVVIRAGTPKVASEVPQSVSVVGLEQMDEIAPVHIGEVLAQVPGVAGVGSGSFFGQGFNIRGFGSSSMAASEAGIVQLIDGEKKYYESYRQGSLFVEPDFLRQVTVLRGPGSSTLYGSGAVGGIIAMETIEAGDLIPEGATSGGKAKLGYASNPRSYLGSVAYGWRPTEDFEAVAAFAYRKLGDTKDADGNVTVRSNSKAPNLLLKAKKTFGDHYVALSYQHLEAKGRNQDFNQLEGAQVGVFYPGFPGWGVGDITTRDQTAKLVWGWNPADNRYIDLTATLSYTNTIKNIEQGTNPREPIMRSLLGKRDYALVKLRVNNTADLSGDSYEHILSAGVEAWKQDRSSSTVSASHPEAWTRAWAAYALSQVTWGDLSVNTGLRYEVQRTEPKSTVTFTSDKHRFEAIEPQIAALYRLNDQWSAFGSVSYVGRIPNVDELYDGSMVTAPNPNLKDEKGKNVEFGLSYRANSLLAEGDEIVAKVTYFRNHITNMIARSGDGPNAYFTNIDRAYLRGGELEANYLQNQWEFGAAVSIVDGENQDGKILNTLPNDRVTLSANWRASDSWKIGLRSTLAAGRDKPNGTHRPGYGVHDIYATWTPQSGAAKGVEVHMGIDNFANRDYTPATWVTGPAPGRNFKLSVSRAF